jgi:hypothetical protein
VGVSGRSPDRARPSRPTLDGVETAYLVLLILAFVAIAAVSVLVLVKLFAGQR